MSYETNFSSDPAKSGPGLWFAIHTLAKEADTEEKKKSFLLFIESIQRNHPCGECRNHMKEYITTHPIKNFWNTKDENGKEIGTFLWSFVFHNAVNSRLNKKQMDWLTAYQMYSNDTIIPCTSDCGKKEVKEVPRLRFTRRER